MQGRNREQTCEHGRGRGNEMNWEIGTGLNTLPCVKRTANGNLQCRAGSSAQWSVITQMAGWRGWEEGGMCIHRADSLHCAADTNTAW